MVYTVQMEESVFEIQAVERHVFIWMYGRAV